MKVATLVGLILIVAGAIGFALGGFSFTRRETVLEAGPIRATAEQRHSVPISPIVSGLAVAAGIFLVVVGSRRV